MHSPIQVEIAAPQHGWATVTLSFADAEVTFPASYTPYDSIGLLASAIVQVVDGVSEVKVPFNTEPDQYDLRFSTDAGSTRIELLSFPFGRRRSPAGDKMAGECVAAFTGDTHTACRPFWMALRSLQGAVPLDAYERDWRHSFPAAEVARLTEHFRRRRRP